MEILWHLHGMVYNRPIGVYLWISWCDTSRLMSGTTIFPLSGDLRPRPYSYLHSTLVAITVDHWI